MTEKNILETTIGSVVFFIFFSLLLMIFCVELKKYTKLPVSIYLLVTGILFRAIAPYTRLSTSLDIISGADTQIIVLIVLPILLLQSSYSVNWHMLKKSLGQILILAVGITVVNAFFIACTVKYVLGYSFAWSMLIMLGVILSSTDAIILHKIMKETYASDNVETLITGEAVLNGGVIFVLFQALIEYETTYTGAGYGLLLITRLTCLGIVAGIVFGFGMELVVKRFLNDFFLETNTCVISGYLLVWFCNSSNVHASAGLAIIVYGLYFAAYGQQVISAEIGEKVKDFISICASNMECVAFILCGVIFGDLIIYKSQSLEAFDYYSILLVFVIVYLTRGLTLLLFYPIMRYCKFDLTTIDYLMLWMGGLKGIISCCLSIIVFNSAIMDQHFKELVVLFSVGNAALSILLGSFVFKRLIRHFGHQDVQDVQENMLLGVTHALVHACEEKYDELRSSGDTQLVNWDEVLEFAGPSSMIHSVLKGMKNGDHLKANLKDFEVEDFLKHLSNKLVISSSAVLIEMRRRYLQTLKGLYWEFYKQGMCHVETSTVLMDACDICLDREKKPMHDWQAVKRIAYRHSTAKFYGKLSKCFLIGKFFRKRLYKQVILAYDSSHNFIKGHKEAEELIEKMEIDIDPSVFEEIIKESNAQVAMCEEFLRKHIIDCYPEVIAEVQSKRCSKALLYFQKKIVEKIYEEGLVKEVEYDALKGAIESSIRAVTFRGLPSMPILREIFESRFAAADSSEINYLMSKVTEKRFKSGALIYLEGEPANGAYYIIRGRINERSSWVDQELVIGNIVGVQHLLQDFSETNLSTAHAITDSILAHLPKELLNLDGFISDIYKEASEEILLLNRDKYELADIDEKYVIRLTEASKVYRYRKGKVVTLLSGAMVLKGKLYEKQKKPFIRPSQKKREVLDDSIVMTFPDDFAEIYSREDPLAESIKKYSVRNTTVVRPKKEIIIEEGFGINNESQNEDVTNLASATEVDLKDSFSFKRRKTTVVPLNAI